LKGIEAMRKIILLALSVFGYTLTSDSPSSHHIFNLDQFGIDLICNAQDENGNTMLHRIALAKDSEKRRALYEEIELLCKGEVFSEGELINTVYKVPNPYIKNNNGKTADELFQETEHVTDNALWITYLDFIKHIYSTGASNMILYSCSYNCNTNLYTVYSNGVWQEYTHDEMKQFIHEVIFFTLNKSPGEMILRKIQQ